MVPCGAFVAVIKAYITLACGGTKCVPQEDMEIKPIPPLVKNFVFFAKRYTPKHLQLFDEILYCVKRKSEHT